VSGLGPGDHACLVFDIPARRDALVLSFFEEGLLRGDGLVYVDSGTDGRVAADLSRRATDGQLIVIRGEDAYLQAGGFEPDRVLTMWGETIRTLRAAGFSSIRSAGGPPLALTCNGHSHELPDYERRAGELIAGRSVTAMCAYDMRKTDATALLGIVDAHPIVIYAVRPDGRLRVEQESPTRLHPRGWIDVTTLGSLVGPLSDALASGGNVEIDLRDVDFVDLGGWRLFVEAAGLLAEQSLDLTVRSAPEWAVSVLGMLGYGEEEGLILQ